MDYQRAKADATDADPAVRARLAARDDAPPEILVFLAEDSDPQVRRALAANANAPRHGDITLAKDPDGDVRGELATKIARVLPELQADTHDRLYNLTVKALEQLARDQAERVRALLAETVQAMPEVPHRVVRSLAEDTAARVAVPVLRSSPLLTDNDLMEIAARSQVPEALAAIAQRGDLSSEVCAAVTESGDETAIATLLNNHAAHIREDTLEKICEQAPAHESWHAPLVRRPTLPARIAQRLAEFVATALVHELAARSDLDADTTAQISQALQQRLAAETQAGPAERDQRTGGRGGAESPLSRLQREVASLHKQGRLLDDELIVTRLGNGDKTFVTVALAELGGISHTTVEQILNAHSARAICSLAWYCGLKASTALQLQISLAGIPPNQAIRARSGKYPLNAGDMAWQLEFFGIELE